MGDQGQPGNGSGEGGGGGGNAEPTLKDIVAQLTQLKTDMDTRFDGFAKKTKERFETLESSAKPTQSQGNGAPQGGDRKETASAPINEKDLEAKLYAKVRIDMAREGLEEEQREQLDSFVKQHGTRAAADMLHLLAPSARNGVHPGANPPKGRAATQASSAAPPLPKTASELLKLSLEERQKVIEHPDFDESKLSMI